MCLKLSSIETQIRFGYSSFCFGNVLSHCCYFGSRTSLERSSIFVFGFLRFFRSVVLSADGSSVLTASDDETARMWDSFSGECKQTFSGHTGYVMSAVFQLLFRGLWTHPLRLGLTSGGRGSACRLCPAPFLPRRGQPLGGLCFVPRGGWR